MADDERPPDVPDAPAPVQYRFPVEVAVVDLLGAEQVKRIAEAVVARIDTTLRSRG